MNSRYDQVLRAKCIEFTKQKEREPKMSDFMIKMETLEIEAKTQQNDNERINQNLNRLKKILRLPTTKLKN